MPFPWHSLWTCQPLPQLFCTTNSAKLSKLVCHSLSTLLSVAQKRPCASGPTAPPGRMPVPRLLPYSHQQNENAGVARAQTSEAYNSAHEEGLAQNDPSKNNPGINDIKHISILSSTLSLSCNFRRLLSCRTLAQNWPLAANKVSRSTQTSLVKDSNLQIN